MHSAYAAWQRATTRGTPGNDGGWRALVRREWLAALAVLLGGVLLHSMNVLMLATVLPTIVGELGGAALMHWPTTAFVASSIVAATCTGLLTAMIGARRSAPAPSSSAWVPCSARWRRRWPGSSPAASCRASAAGC